MGGELNRGIRRLLSAMCRGWGRNVPCVTGGSTIVTAAAAVALLGSAWPADAAALDDTAIAFCRPVPTDAGEDGGCICSAEGIEGPLAPDEYRAILISWRRQYLLSPSEFAALERERASTCMPGGGAFLRSAQR